MSSSQWVDRAKKEVWEDGDVFSRTTTHLRLGTLAVYPVVVCCVLLAAAQAQEASLHDGQPALIFHGDPSMEIAVGLVDHDGERALRLPVEHSHIPLKCNTQGCDNCTGYLYISHSRVSYDPVYTPKFQQDAFRLSRSDIRSARVIHEHKIGIWTTKRKYVFVALFDSDTGKRVFGGDSAAPLYQFIGRGLNDFDNTLHEAEKLTASLGQAEHPLAPTAPPPSPANILPTPPRTIALGQTKDQVVAAFGQPQKIANLGTKEMYYYPDMRVTFVDGKVTDVQ
jgi:hypothetical protein